MYTLEKVNYLGEDDCVSCAQSVIDKYGGVMYKLPLDYDPYDDDGEPRISKHGEAIDSHYWPIVDNHIVDLWADNILDLNNSDQLEIAEEIYGPTDTWELVSQQELISHFAEG